MGFAASERQKFIEKNGLPFYDGSQEYCLWLGCMGAYDPQGREIVLALVRVLRHAGVTFGVLRKEKCTGDPARRLGNDLAFIAGGGEQHRNAASGQRQEDGVDLPALRAHHRDGLAGSGRHVRYRASQRIAGAAERPAAGRAAGAARETVAYHDPCYLGRYREIYEEPRAVIAQTATVVEAGRTRERSFCCGAGGGQMFLGEEKGKRVNIERAEELVGTGAQVIGTACPFCQTMFRDALGTVTADAAKTAGHRADCGGVAAEIRGGGVTTAREMLY